MGSRSAGGAIAGLGIVLVVVGVILYLYPQDTTLFGIVIHTDYPYRELGTLLLILGIIVTVVGVIAAAIPTRSSFQQPYQAGQPYSPSPYQPRTCPACGAVLNQPFPHCPNCGTLLS